MVGKGEKNPMFGRKHTDEARAKMRAYFTPDIKEKIRLSKLGDHRKLDSNRSPTYAWKKKKS